MMFAHDFKWHFIRVLGALLVSLFWPLAASYGQDEGVAESSSASQADAAPPSAEQVLLSESTFAIQLAEALRLGPVSGGAEAAEVLTNLGIKPRNGWSSERPITRAALGDIEKGISAASDQKKLDIKKDQALKLVDDVKARLSLDKIELAPAAPVDQSPGNKVIYRYTDSDGVLHFTDVYDSIPPEYRKHTSNNADELSLETDDDTTGAPEPQ